MSPQQLITDYGYAAVAIGTFLEGETILALGGFAAHRGYLSLPWVVVCGFVGNLLGDQLYYYIGRWKGDALLCTATGVAAAVDARVRSAAPSPAVADPRLSFPVRYSHRDAFF